MLGWQQTYQKQVEAILQEASNGEEDKIHASAQLTIKPNYLWIGLMRHMLGSKFPDQEVAWEGALVCVCTCVWAWSMCPWPKD